MPYKFIEEREPTDEELGKLMSAASEHAKKKASVAYQKYMENIHLKILKLKKQKQREA